MTLFHAPWPYALPLSPMIGVPLIIVLGDNSTLIIVLGDYVKIIDDKSHASNFPM